MAKVSIAKLLKTKNRLASEITRVKTKITAHNVFYHDKSILTPSPQVDVKALVEELNTLTEKLVEVKSAINTANAKSFDKIFLLAELKGQISLYEKLNVSESLERNYYGDGAVQKAQININERDQIVKNLIKTCEILQDDLDNFNSTHRVEISDDLLL